MGVPCLEWSATADNVTLGPHAEIERCLGSKGTVIYIFRLASDGTRQRWGNSSVAGDREFCDSFLAGDNLIRAYIDRATTYCQVWVDKTQFAAYATATWLIWAFAWDITLTDSDQHQYMGSYDDNGNVVKVIAEASAYDTRSVGSGTIGSVAGAGFIIGNNQGLILPAQARYACVAQAAYQMSLAQLVQFQSRPAVIDDMPVLVYPGYQDKGTVKNFGACAAITGSVSGPVLAAGLPLAGQPYHSVQVPVRPRQTAPGRAR